jgi:cytochrome P450
VGFRVLLGKLMFLIWDRKFWRSCELVRKYTKRQTERALRRETAPTFAKGGKPKYHLVKELGKEIDDEEALHGQLLNVFLGGRDTPAVALGNVMFCLARHPSVWRKIREEVGDMRPEDLTFEKLKSMRYLQHTINEGLRLYPALPHLARECLVETALPFGGGPEGKEPICVVPGDTVAWSTYAMHRNPEAFGADVDSFRPERWQDIRPGWNYTPFGGGARRCPAQQLALFWVSYAIARLALEYQEVESVDAVDEYVESLKLVMESFNGVKVRLIKT